jgi:acetyltransferase-like isoleucine patch superfamily enzyme
MKAAGAKLVPQMNLANSLILKVKNGETPFFRALRRIARLVLRPRAPRIPGLLRPPLRMMYALHFALVRTWHVFWNVCYRHPLFQARCSSFGRDVVLDRLPFVTGAVEIHIGDHVWIGGQVSILSARVREKPLLVLKDYAELGWNVTIAVAKEIIIEEHARISYDCRISDTDGHPREADLRARNAPVHARDVKPIRICKYAWVGNGSHIMKGVTIGEGAVIGANSVVISDIPAYSLALGNPAEVFLRNFGRASRKAGPEV